jgi:hypothetical protein
MALVWVDIGRDMVDIGRVLNMQGWSTRSGAILIW